MRKLQEGNKNTSGRLSKKYRKSKEFALIALSLLVTFSVLEVGARVWLNYFATVDQYNKYVLITNIDSRHFRLTPHHYLNYYTTPNYKKGLTSHNSLGYRNDEFPVRKPNGVFRIAALGGSTTYSEAVEDNAKTFTSQLDKVLSEEYGYQNVHVINAGVPGYTSWESLINLEMRVLDLEPDLLIIYHGTNDVHARLVASQAYHGDNSGYRKQWGSPIVSFWERLSILRILSRRLGFSYQVGVGAYVDASTAEHATDNPMQVLQNHAPLYFRRNLENMVGVARQNEIGIMFATWAHSPNFDDYASTPHYIRGFEENNEVVTLVARKNGIPLFNFEGVMPKEERYWDDGRHVNEAGALLKAEMFAKFIHNEGLIGNTR